MPIYKEQFLFSDIVASTANLSNLSVAVVGSVINSILSELPSSFAKSGFLSLPIGVFTLSKIEAMEGLNEQGGYIQSPPQWGIEFVPYSKFRRTIFTATKTELFTSHSYLTTSFFMAEFEKNADLNEVVKLVAYNTGHSVANVEEILENFLETVSGAVSQTGYVELNKFGSFRLKTHAAQEGKDPHGNPYSVPERISVEFNAFKHFRDTVERAAGKPCIE